MKVFLMPYRNGSAGCRALAETIGAMRIRLQGSRFKPGHDKLVVNWGNSKTDVENPHWLNNPRAVGDASHKVNAFNLMSLRGVSTPEWTTDYYTAQCWLDADETVVVRHQVRGQGGAGIEIVEPGGDLPDAPLYTKYFKAFDEYRVHVFAGNVIDVQQKKKREGVENANFKVRNLENGFVFCRDGVELPDECAAQAIAAVKALGLDFGAVDMRYNKHYNKAAVLEVNTAPGLEGTTLESYSKAITELFQEIMV